jgi:hypothetical protein
MGYNQGGMMPLEKRLQKLEQQFEILKTIVDHDNQPFMCACLEADMDIDQMDQALALITKAEATIGTEKPMKYTEFVEKLYEIVPSQKNNPDLPKDLIKTLNKQFRFNRIYDYFEKCISK